MHSDNGEEFINQRSRVENITKTLHCNLSSNTVERWYRTIVGIFRAMGREMQDEWDLCTDQVRIKLKN